MDFQHTHEVRWSEICGSNDVHFTQWLLYMEEAEYAFLRSRGLSVVLEDQRGMIGFPRLSCELSICGAAMVEHSLSTQVRLELNDGKQLEYRFEMYQRERLLAHGRFLVACCRFPASGKPYAIPIPDWVMEKLPEVPPRF